MENAGGGVLSGSASVPAPFAIVSGGSYSLGAGASQVVTVTYTPVASGTDSQTVTCTGGGGVTAQVSGTAGLRARRVADVGGDYANSSAPPAGWAYLRSTTTVGGGGTETPLLPTSTIGNGGNTGFGGNGSSSFHTPCLLGGINGGAQYEIFNDGDVNSPVAGTDLLLHPGQSTATTGDQFVIARYTFRAADVTNGNRAAIAGSFRELIGPTAGSSANSITAEIYHNTKLLWTADGSDPSGTDGNPKILSEADGTFNLSTTVAEGDTLSFVVDSNGNYTGDETALRATVDIARPAMVIEHFGFDGGGGFFVTCSGLDTATTYELMRSTNLITFTPVVGAAKVPVAATDTFTDPSPPTGRAFYQLWGTGL